MKKRNWLMTIAFAVLSLTIVSTMVIGTTYAKFTSTISGNTTVRAAGFLITGSTASVSDSILIAPGKTENVEIALKYFSQVDTVISSAANANNDGNTGVFTSTNWDAIVAFYEAHAGTGAGSLYRYFGIDAKVAEATQEHPYDGIPGGTAFGTGNEPEVADLIAVDGDGMVAAFLKKISDNNTTTGLGTGALAVKTGGLVKAMAADATNPLTVALTVPVAWTTHTVGGDVFDTLIGNCIAALAAPGAGYSNVTSDGSTHVNVWFDLDKDGTVDSGETLQLTVAAAELATGVLSRVSVAIGMTATQYTGAAIDPSTWNAPADGGVTVS